MLRSARAASNSTQCPSDPYQDPRNDPCNALGYIANNALTAVAFVYVIGFGFRFALHYNPDSLGIYIAEYLMIVLSPCFFIAANYVLLGRLAREIDSVHQVLLPVRRLTLIFVLSDVTTFVIQAAGASMTTSTVYNSALTGLHIFLAGLVLQLTSFLFFCVIYARPFGCETQSNTGIAIGEHSAAAMAVSCIGILIRSCYRVAEVAQGFHGSLGSSETAFYLGDTLPLCLAIVIYVPFWPGRFITGKIAPSYVSESQTGQELLVSRGALGYNE
ncbi:RTA1 like protein-domain-containing protein [Suillus lakei]|nr:RTA1 like protein-domain-containing protein [Suillus lakei]